MIYQSVCKCCISSYWGKAILNETVATDLKHQLLLDHTETSAKDINTYLGFVPSCNMTLKSEMLRHAGGSVGGQISFGQIPI